MNISGIRPCAGFYDYNSIKASEIRNQQIQASQQSDSVQQEPVGVAMSTQASAQTAVEQNYTQYDYAQQYRPGERHELKGADSDIYSLDTQKAISDLDKDQILQQYQYFVGNKNQGEVTKTADQAAGLPRSGENFFL